MSGVSSHRLLSGRWSNCSSDLADGPDRDLIASYGSYRCAASDRAEGRRAGVDAAAQCVSITTTLSVFCVVKRIRWRHAIGDRTPPGRGTCTGPFAGQTHLGRPGCSGRGAYGPGDCQGRVDLHPDRATVDESRGR